MFCNLYDGKEYDKQEDVPLSDLSGQNEKGKNVTSRNVFQPLNLVFYKTKLIIHGCIDKVIIWEW